jgi:hypothetical protein
MKCKRRRKTGFFVSSALEVHDNETKIIFISLVLSLPAAPFRSHETSPFQDVPSIRVALAFVASNTKTRFELCLGDDSMIFHDTLRLRWLESR